MRQPTEFGRAALRSNGATQNRQQHAISRSVLREPRRVRPDRLSCGKHPGARMDRNDDGASAMEAAAKAAIAYRRSVAEAERTPVADYAEMLAAFAGPTPQPG